MVFAHQRRFRVRTALTTAALIITALFSVSILIAPSVTDATNQTIPYLINFQGRLTDNNGNVMADGDYNIKFRLYNVATGGSNVWEADRVYGSSDHRVSLQNGLFDIQLGDTTQGDPALTTSLFNEYTEGELYLEVELPTPATATCASNGCATWTEGAMTPRQPLASSPYAFNSQDLDGLDASAFGQLTAAQTWTGTNTYSASSAAAIVLSGSAASGGSILQIGSALSGGNAAGTLFGANTTTTGDLLNLQVSNNSELKVDSSGDITSAGNFQFTQGSGHSLGVAQAVSGTGNSLTLTAGQSGTNAFNGGNLYLEAGASATGGAGTAGSVVVKANGVDSATAFQIQNATGVSVLTADTVNSSLAINTTTADATLTIAADALHTVTQVYSTSGTSNLTLPADVTAVTVKAWGAGGGGGAGSAGTALGGAGGGGGFAQASVSTVGGATLSVDVGSGGAKAGTNEFGGAGGGYSGVRTGSTYLIQAGGGGGGGGALNNTNSAGAGGAGGGNSGVVGGNGAGTGPGLGGQPGTNSGGGAGGTGGSGTGAAGISNAAGDAAGSAGTCTTNTGNAGTGGTGGGGAGGDSATCENGGGGGGGGYGGGGGGSANGNNRGGGGGGGGGDLVTGTGTTETQGSGVNAANTADPSYPSCAASAGVGGSGATSIAGNTGGQVGCVVVSYQTATNNTTAFDVQNSTGGDSFQVLANGDAVLQNDSDNTQAFQVQNASGSPVLTVDTADNKLAIGGAGGANPTLLVIDSAASDPSTGYDGAEYYNTSTDTFRCYQAGAWTDCITPPDTVTATANGTGNYVSSLLNATASTAGQASQILDETTATAFTETPADTEATFVAPAAGSFRSCFVEDDAAITAGTISMRWRVNGVSVGSAACTMNTTNTRESSSALDSGVVSFAAGATIGVAFDTSGLAPTTNDFTAYWSVDYDASSGNGLTEQFVYDSSSSPAAINLSDSKDFDINATGTTTSPNIVDNLECTVSCGSNGRFAVQNGGTDVFTVSPNNGGITLGTNTAFGTNSISGTGTITAGTINATSSLEVGGVAGTASSCGGGSALTGATFSSGILTVSGSCTAFQAAGNYLVQAPVGTANTITAASGAQDLILKGTNGTATDLLDIYNTAASPALVSSFNSNGAFVTTAAISAPTTGSAINGLSINSGALSSVTSLTLSGAISGGTTYSGSGNINTTSGEFTVNGVQISSANLSDGASITKLGNSVNGASDLVELNASSQLPAVSGNLLTNLNPTNLIQGSGIVSLESANATTLTVDSGTTGQINIGTDTADAKTIQIGPSGTDTSTTTYNLGTNLAGTQDINFGSTGSGNAAAGTNVSIQGGTGASAIVLGTNGAGVISIDSGTTGAINIGGGTTSAKTITLGPSGTDTSTTTYDIGVNTAGSQDINLGSTSSGNAAAGTTVDIQGGTTAATAVTIGTNGAGGVTIDSGTTGAVNLGTGAHAKTVTIGNTTAATTVVISGGSGAGDGINIGDDTSTEEIDLGGVTNAGTHTINVGTNATSVDTINIGNTNSTSSVDIQAGSSDIILNTATGNSVDIGSGATSDANQTLLNLDSFSTFADTASCTGGANEGAMYYNTATNAIRSCVNNNWEDVVTTSGLGILTFGVIPDSANAGAPGDIEGITNYSNSPCKVVWGSATSVVVEPCTAYSGGRKVIVAQTTINLTGTTLPANDFANICLTGTNDAPALGTANATETTAAHPAFSANNPILCLATIKASATAGDIGFIWDTRTFTNTQKEFATVDSVSNDGFLVVGTTTAAMYQVPTTTAATFLRGVVVATSGAASTNTINAIIAVKGPAYVKFISGGTATVNNVVESLTTTAGYGTSVAGTAAVSNYIYGGPLESSISTSCTTQNTAASACQYSPLIDFAPSR